MSDGILISTKRNTIWWSIFSYVSAWAFGMVVGCVVVYAIHLKTMSDAKVALELCKVYIETTTDSSSEKNPSTKFKNNNDMEIEI